MAEAGKPDAATLRARLEFPVWHRAFARSYAAWSSAPSDLKSPLLLSGSALAKAESWLLACPERLSDSEKRYIVRSISQSSRSAPAQQMAGRSGRISRISRHRQTDRSLWQLYAVIAVGLWIFAPDFIKNAMEASLNAPEVAQEKKGGPMVIATPNAKLDPELAVAPSPPPPPPPEIAAEPDRGSAGTSVEETPPRHVPAAAPEPAPSGAARLTSLARQHLDSGQHRLALLLAMEAVDVALKEQPEAEIISREAAGVLLGAMATRTSLAPLSHRGFPAVTALFCDGAKGLVAATHDGNLAAWPRPSTISATHIRPWQGSLDGVSVDRDCRRLAAGNEDHNVEIRPLDGGKPLAMLIGHEGPILASSFSPDGLTLATASEDSNVRIWDTRSGRMRALLSGHDWQVTSVAFSADGRRLITGARDNTARIWDAATGRPIHALDAHRGVVTSVQFSPDATLALTTSWDGFVRLWHVAGGQLVRSIRLDNASILAARFNADGSRIATISEETAVHLWESASGRQIAAVVPPGQGTVGVEFAPDGRWLTTLTWSGKAVLHDAVIGAAISTLNGEADRVRAVAFSGGGTSVVGITEAGQRLAWPLAGTAAEAFAQAKSVAPACLSADERVLLGLDAEQPAWCKDLPIRGATLPQ